MIYQKKATFTWNFFEERNVNEKKFLMKNNEMAANSCKPGSGKLELVGMMFDLCAFETQSKQNRAAFIFVFCSSIYRARC